MKDLSTYVAERDGQKVVDSRKIHEFLGVKTPHRIWMPRKIEELGLVNGVDFQADKSVRLGTRSNGSGKATTIVYYLTQRAAEHLGMAETNEKGSQIRDAFIAARDAGRKLAESELERKSKDARKTLASRWGQHGLRGGDFAQATIKEYEVAFGDREIRKPMMDNRQKTVLAIYEMTESLKLDASPEIRGLEAIEFSLEETGRALTQTFQKLRIAGA